MYRGDCIIRPRKKSLLVLILRSPRFSEATKKNRGELKKGDFVSFQALGPKKRVKCSFLTNVFNLTFNQHKMTFHLSYCTSLYDNFFPLHRMSELTQRGGEVRSARYILTKKQQKINENRSLASFFPQGQDQNQQTFFWPNT